MNRETIKAALLTGSVTPSDLLGAIAEVLSAAEAALDSSAQKGWETLEENPCDDAGTAGAYCAIGGMVKHLATYETLRDEPWKLVVAFATCDDDENAGED